MIDEQLRPLSREEIEPHQTYLLVSLSSIGGTPSFHLSRISFLEKPTERQCLVCINGKLSVKKPRDIGLLHGHTSRFDRIFPLSAASLLEEIATRQDICRYFGMIGIPENRRCKALMMLMKGGEKRWEVYQRT